MKVAFAGTPEFASAALARLHAARHDVVLVLTQPDRPAGRGMKLQPSAVKAFAVDHGLALIQPRSLRLDGKFPDDAATARAALVNAAPEVLVVAAYGLILPPWALALARLGCLNIHASLLPRWRGAAPIHRAIEAGDAQTGITIMQMDAGLDTGGVLLVEAVDIAADDTTGSLHDRLADLGGRLIVQALELAGSGRLRATPQPDAGVTYAKKIDKTEAQIDWSRPADVIGRRIRAFDPQPGANTLGAGEALKVWRADVESGRGEPGRVVSASHDGIRVACGEGVLRITELQRAGGKRVSAAQFVQGRAPLVGARLGTAPD